MWNCRQWDCIGSKGDGSDTSKIPHGEPHAGKPHVAPSLCYGVTDRFDVGQPPKTAKSVLRVTEDRAGVLDEGRPALLYTHGLQEAW